MRRKFCFFGFYPEDTTTRKAEKVKGWAGSPFFFIRIPSKDKALRAGPGPGSNLPLLLT